MATRSRRDYRSAEWFYTYLTALGACHVRKKFRGMSFEQAWVAADANNRMWFLRNVRLMPLSSRGRAYWGVSSTWLREQVMNIPVAALDLPPISVVLEWRRQRRSSR